MLNDNELKKLKNVKIAISGKSGCGNTTVSRLLADALELRFINFTFRSLAREKGLEMKKIMELAAEDDSWDREVDSRQVALAREPGGCVLGSRLAIWILPEADLKIYLTALPEIRAKRIHNREGGDLKQIIAFTASRDRQDRERYLKIYKIDNDDYSFADMILDAGELRAAQIVGKIIEKLKEKKG